MAILIRGAGDIATGIALRLYRAGFQIVMTDLPQPTSIRRTVCFSEALRLVASHRHGSVLLRRAMGDTLREIANDRGTTVEWARQMEVAARSHVRTQLRAAA